MRKGLKHRPVLAESASYTNTSFASVTHYEYGHHIINSAGSGQGEYGEGMADSIAVLDACNAGLGIGFYLNQCTTRLCNADNTCQYSASSCSSGGSEIHSCGQLISGIIRSIRKNLAVTLPNTYVDLINKLTLSSILVHTGTAINAQIAIDMLTLDDDDGNINNGTPHYSEICSGFSEKPSQGLGRRWGEVREFTSRTRGGPRPALSKMFKTGPFMGHVLTSE